MLKTSSKALSIFLIFVAPVIIIFTRYSSDKVTTVQTQLGIVPLLFILTIAFVLLWFVSNQFMEMVRTDKFGSLSITFFGLMLAIILFLVWFVLQYVVNLAKTNLDLFVSNFTYHQETLFQMLMFISAGVALVIGTAVLTWRKKP